MPQPDCSPASHYFKAHIVQDANPDVQRSYSLKNLPRIEPCAGPECVGGGLDLHVVAGCVDTATHHFYCPGYLNGPRGAPSAHPCSNHFEVRIRLMRVIAAADAE